MKQCVGCGAKIKPHVTIEGYAVDEWCVPCERDNRRAYARYMAPRPQDDGFDDDAWTDGGRYSDASGRL